MLTDNVAHQLPASLANELLAWTTTKPSFSAPIANIFRVTPKEQEKILNSLQDRLERMKAQVVEDSFDQLQSFIKCFGGGLSEKLRSRLVVIVSSAVNAAGKDATIDNECLARIVFLALQTVQAAESDKSFNWTPQKGNMLYGLKAILLQRRQLPSVILSVIVKTVHCVLEGGTGGIAMEGALECLFLACNRHGVDLCSLIQQNLTYNDSLSESMAALCARLLLDDDGSPVGRECVFRVLQGIIDACSSSDESTARIQGPFFSRLAALAPSACLPLLPRLSPLTDSPHYQMRMAMLDVLKELLSHCASNDGLDAIPPLFGAIVERLRDVSTFVRSKALHVQCDLVKVLPVSLREHVTNGAISRLHDKSGTVRRRALSLLVALIHSHPFCVDGGILKRSLFEGRLSQLQSHGTTDGSGDKELLLLQQQHRYYTDALQFVSLLDSVMLVVTRLLQLSHAANPLVSKSEVCDGMDFVVQAHVYGLESSMQCIQALLPLIHLGDKVASPATEEEESVRKNVKEHLLKTFKLLLFGPSDVNLPLKDQSLECLSTLAAFIRPLSVAQFACLDGIVQEMPLGNETKLVGAMAEACIAELRRCESPVAAAILFLLCRRAKSVSFLRHLPELLRSCRSPLAAKYLLQTASSVLVAGDERKKLPVEHDLNGVWTEAIKLFYATSISPQKNIEAMLRVCSKSASSLGRIGCLLHCIGQAALCHAAFLEDLQKQGNNINDKDEQQQTVADWLPQVKQVDMSKGLLFQYMPLVRQSLQYPLLADLARTCMARLVMAVSAIEACRQLYLPCIGNRTLLSNDVIALADTIQLYGQQLRQQHQMDEEESENYGSFDEPLFQALLDHSTQSTALLCITRLCLNGLLKIRPRWYTVLLHLTASNANTGDKDAGIARMFFAELATKDGGNAIYNLLPHVVFSSNGSSNGGYEEECRFLLSFVHKERQLESLTEKLVSRLSAIHTRRPEDLPLARRIALTLKCVIVHGNTASVPKLLTKLMSIATDNNGGGNFVYLLGDRQVFRAFGDIVHKAKKVIKDPAMRANVDQWEQWIIRTGQADSIDHSGIDEEEESEEKAFRGVHKVDREETDKPMAAAQKKKGQQPPRRKTVRIVPSEDEEQSNNNDDDNSDTNVHPVSAVTTQKSPLLTALPLRATRRSASTVLVPRRFGQDDSALRRGKSKNSNNNAISETDED